jgi:hypothetical protein
MNLQNNNNNNIIASFEKPLVLFVSKTIDNRPYFKSDEPVHISTPTLRSCSVTLQPVVEQRKKTQFTFCVKCEILPAPIHAQFGSICLHPENIKSLSLGANWNYSK